MKTLIMNDIRKQINVSNAMYNDFFHIIIEGIGILFEKNQILPL